MNATAAVVRRTAGTSTLVLGALLVFVLAPWNWLAAASPANLQLSVSSSDPGAMVSSDGRTLTFATPPPQGSTFDIVHHVVMSNVGGTGGSGTLALSDSSQTMLAQSIQATITELAPATNTLITGSLSASHSVPVNLAAGASISLQIELKLQCTSTCNQLSGQTVRPVLLLTQSAQANSPPIAALAASPTSTVWGSHVQFSSAGTSDPGGTISRWTLNYGDRSAGSAGSGAPPTVLPPHTYATPNTYIATLTVTDTAGASSTATAAVTVVKRNTTSMATAALEVITGHHLVAALSGKLVDATSGNGVAGRKVTFTVGQLSCSATTRLDGTVSCTVTGKLKAATPTSYLMSFAGDNLYNPSRGVGSLSS